MVDSQIGGIRGRCAGTASQMTRVFRQIDDFACGSPFGTPPRDLLGRLEGQLGRLEAIVGTWM
eukprot:3968608-Pyramimonas_sp.AAC.1